MITYETGNDLDVETVRELYRSCSLGARRPIDVPGRLEAMIDHANLVVTAWDAEDLVGIARSVSDYAYTTYLADLAVRGTRQREGIGRGLIERTRSAAPDARVVLLAAPAAVDYYPRIGFERHESAWTLPPGRVLRS